ncbi:pre-peptidase C-terminal domain-containing protein [Acidobacteria bacterium AH-259-A15]|nr:pre-peptidase C-terminal domain-containing protein [Acidobacteria bacterium AH-259-A15]
MAETGGSLLEHAKGLKLIQDSWLFRGAVPQQPSQSRINDLIWVESYLMNYPSIEYSLEEALSFESFAVFAAANRDSNAKYFLIAFFDSYEIIGIEADSINNKLIIFDLLSDISIEIDPLFETNVKLYSGSITDRELIGSLSSTADPSNVQFVSASEALQTAQCMWNELKSILNIFEAEGLAQYICTTDNALQRTVSLGKSAVYCVTGSFFTACPSLAIEIGLLIADPACRPDWMNKCLSRDIVTLNNGQPVTGSVNHDEEDHYKINVPSGVTQLKVEMTGTNDADLHVEYNSQASKTNWDCRPYKAGSNETCTFSNPSSGDWFIMVHGFSGGRSDYTLKATYTSQPTAPHISSFTTSPSPPIVAQPFNFELTGTFPSNPGVYFFGPGCSSSTLNCKVPDSAIQSKTATRIKGAAQLNTAGDYTVRVRNESTGQFSNEWSLTVVSDGGGTGTCTNPINLTAGQSYSANTSGGQSNFGSYSCSSWNESGPERVHRITLNSPGTISAQLTNLSADLDVFILSSCSSSSCLAFGNSSASANVGTGTYYIVVDGYQGAVGTYTLTVDVTGGGGSGPDLVVTELTTSSSSGTPGGKIFISSLKVKNQGDTDAGPFQVGFYYSTDSTISTSDTFSGWRCDVNSGLVAGGTYSCSGEIAVPSSLAPGTYYVGAIADHQGVVSESNEGNNTKATGPIPIN